jgi:hypothetical protein
MGKMRPRLERSNQSNLAKQAAGNKRSATAELNVILADYFKQKTTAAK